MMGLMDSLYHTCQAGTWANNIELGDSRESSNPLRYERVVVNFLGLEGY